MTLLRFLEPIRPDDPCDPDPFEARDDPFEIYLNDAEERLLQCYFDEWGKALIDAASIKVAAEIRAALGLLECSRDRRLQSLNWRTQAIARDQRTPMAEDAQTPDGEAVLLALRPTVLADLLPPDDRRP